MRRVQPERSCGRHVRFAKLNRESSPIIAAGKIQVECQPSMIVQRGPSSDPHERFPFDRKGPNRSEYR